jgi:phage shock protein PspC (stress-responsive transcriptional regulator)
MSDEKHDETSDAPEAPGEMEGAEQEQAPEVQAAAAAEQAPEEAPDEAVTEPAQQTEMPATAVAAPPPPFPAERRLVRRPEGKIIAGVCSGIAAYFGLDPVIVRVAAVLLAVFGGGVGLVAYVIAWLVMPMAPEGEPVVSLPPRDDSNMGRWIGIGAIVLGAIVLFHNVWDFRGGIFWGLLLVGLGIALWGRELAPRSDRPDRPINPPVPPTPSSGSAVGTNPTTPLPPVPPAFPPTRQATSAAPAPSPVRREPSLLGRAVVGAAALAVGIALLLDNTDVLNVTPKGVVTVLLVIVGVGLLIGTWIGRARWLIIPGLVLALLLGTLAILPEWQFGDGAGERLWRPQSLSQLRSEYRLGAGELLVDLSDIDFDGRSRNVEARVGMGELLFIVPEDVTVHADAQVGAGEVDLFGRSQGGLGVNDEARDDGERGAGRLDIDAQVGFGEITVRRADDTADLNEVRRGRINIGLDRFGVPGVVVEDHRWNDVEPAETGAGR